MVQQKTSRYHRKVPRDLRRVMSQTVFDCLDPSQQDVARQHGHKAVSFYVVTYGRARKKVSPLGAAHAVLMKSCGEYALAFADDTAKAIASAKKVLKYWFRELNDQHIDSVLKGTLRSTEDMRRARSVGEGMLESQWQVGCDALTKRTWGDRHGNDRRFFSLEEYATWLQHQIRYTGCQQLKQELAELNALYKDSRARSWHGLENAVVEHFHLRKRKELFHAMRSEAKAFWCAKRWAGLEPMVETYRSRQQPGCCPKKVIQCLPLLSEEEVLSGKRKATPYKWSLEPTWLQVCTEFAFVSLLLCDLRVGVSLMMTH